jgi:hypothetical protein
MYSCRNTAMINTVQSAFGLLAIIFLRAQGWMPLFARAFTQFIGPQSKQGEASFLVRKIFVRLSNFARML